MFAANTFRGKFLAEGRKAGFHPELRVSLLPSLFSVWISRHRSRLALAKLEEHGLDDVGLTKPEVVDEIAKPFWVE